VTNHGGLLSFQSLFGPLHKIGAIDRAAMLEFDAAALSEPDPPSPVDGDVLGAPRAERIR
jgi:hypothetical protein